VAARIVTELYRHEGKLEPNDIFVIQPGGFEDEANWRYDKTELSQDDLKPIEEVLLKHMPATDKIYWCISKFGERYSMRKVTWTGSSLWGNTPDELAQEVLKYYLKYPMLDKQYRSNWIN
jgi:hypothetical protein